MSDKYKVGDRVQDDELVDGKPVIRVGVLTEVNEVEKSYTRTNWSTNKDYEEKYMSIENMKVKWDTGEEETVGPNDVYEEDSADQRAYRLVALKAGALIDAQLAIANAAIDKAEEISEKYGVPFSAGVSPLSQSYFPSSASDKFPDLDADFMNELVGAYHSEYGGEGWQHSAVCY